MTYSKSFLFQCNHNVIWYRDKFYLLMFIGIVEGICLIYLVLILLTLFLFQSHRNMIWYRNRILIMMYIGIVEGICLILYVLCCCARIGCLQACCCKYSQTTSQESQNQNSRVFLAPYQRNPPPTSPEFITPILPIIGSRQNGPPTWSHLWSSYNRQQTV